MLGNLGVQLVFWNLARAGSWRDARISLGVVGPRAIVFNSGMMMFW
jgi:hypothetical protein